MLRARIDPARAREDAHRILSDRRFRHDPAPRPLRGPLVWLGDRLRSFGHVITRILRAFPGPTWTAVAALVVFAAIALVVWLVSAYRTGGVGAFSHAGITRGAAREDPAGLERLADDAERQGDLERALRLRFRAGLLRLDERGVIRYRPSLTTGEVRRLLGSATFDELAARFEEVAYGRDPAVPGDVATARSNWPRVVEDSTRT